MNDLSKIERYLKWIFILLLLIFIQVAGLVPYIKQSWEFLIRLSVGFWLYLHTSDGHISLIVLFCLFVGCVFWLDHKKNKKLAVDGKRQCNRCHAIMPLEDRVCTHCGLKKRWARSTHVE